jgi:type I restriction enzyme R subunit
MASPKEAHTRQHLIDRQLTQTGWTSAYRDANVLREYTLKHSNPKHRVTEDRATYTANQTEFADYVLLGKDRKPVAVVEAKRSSRDALSGKRQAADYADLILQQDGVDVFIFLTNGPDSLTDWTYAKGVKIERR